MSPFVVREAQPRPVDRGLYSLNIQARVFLLGLLSVDMGALMGSALSAGHATSASRCSKLPSSTKSGWPRQNEKKPSEVGSARHPGER